jgi:hypothetical protein
VIFEPNSSAFIVISSKVGVIGENPAGQDPVDRCGDSAGASRAEGQAMDNRKLKSEIVQKCSAAFVDWNWI